MGTQGARGQRSPLLERPLMVAETQGQLGMGHEEEHEMSHTIKDKRCETKREKVQYKSPVLELTLV